MPRDTSHSKGKRVASRERTTVRLKKNTHQPNKDELEEDVSIQARPQAVARAIVNPVRVIHRGD